MDISPPPSRDKLPVEKDPSGKTWAVMPREWLKWFDSVRKILEENVIKYEAFADGATETVGGHEGHLAVMDYYTSLGHKYLSGHDHWHSIGYNSAVGATQEDITEIGAATYVPPADAGIQMTVRSASANDTAAGTGVRTVEINYLDASGIEQTEVVSTNGGAVNTVATDIRRVNYFHTVTAGSLGAADGIISLTNTANTVTYALIAAGGNFSRHGFFTIPSNKTGYVTSAYIGAGNSVAGRFVRCLFRATTNHMDVLTPGIFQFKRMVLVQDGGIQIEFRIPLKVPSLTDIKFSGTNDVGAEVASYVEGWME